MTALLALSAALGGILAAGALFYLFAAGMSDAPGEGHPRTGCGVAVIGLLLCAGSVAALIVRAYQ